MSILEKEVLVTVNNNTYQYYEDLGYIIPRSLDVRGKKLIIKRGTQISIKIEHLPKESHLRVTKFCDECGENCGDKEYRAILRDRHDDDKDRCLKCGQKQRDIKRKVDIKYEKSLEYYAKNNNKEYLLDEFSDKNNKKPINISYGTHDQFIWDCFICGEEYTAKANSRTGNDSGCPFCKQSKGELKIKKWLDNHEISYISQKTFNGLIGLGGRLLSYDFYLPNYNLLIEYQGEFHDGSSRGYVLKNLSKQREHDKRKSDFAKDNRIDLLEIWYYDFENVEDVLAKKLFT